MSEYYFRLQLIGGEEYFLITPKEYFDTQGCLFDDEIPELEELISTSGFDYLTDSTYEYTEGNLDSGRRVLLQLGFIENNNL